MARESKYVLLQVGENPLTDLEDVGRGSEPHEEAAVLARGGAGKYVKMFAMLVLLVGAVGIYSMASSTAEVTKAQPSNQASEAQFYEVSEDTADSTAPPGVTVVGQLRMQVSDPATFAKDPAAMQAVKESIAKIAGVPVSAVKEVKMFPVSGASGMVQADFKIDVPADNADQIVERISSSTPEADSKILAGEIAAAGLSAKYPETKVVMISASMNPCDTTPGPENPCDTTSAPASPTPGPENPCATTSAPENPCGTTQATGVLAKIFR